MRIWARKMIWREGEGGRGSLCDEGRLEELERPAAVAIE